MQPPALYIMMWIPDATPRQRKKAVPVAGWRRSLLLLAVRGRRMRASASKDPAAPQRSIHFQCACASHFSTTRKRNHSFFSFVFLARRRASRSSCFLPLHSQLFQSFALTQCVLYSYHWLLVATTELRSSIAAAGRCSVAFCLVGRSLAQACRRRRIASIITSSQSSCLVRSTSRSTRSV